MSCGVVFGKKQSDFFSGNNRSDSYHIHQQAGSSWSKTMAHAGGSKSEETHPEEEWRLVEMREIEMGAVSPHSQVLKSWLLQFSL